MTCKSWQSHPVTQSHSTSSECSECSVHQLCWLLFVAMLVVKTYQYVMSGDADSTKAPSGRRRGADSHDAAPRLRHGRCHLCTSGFSVKTRGLTDGRCFFVDSASRMFFFTWKVIFCCAKVQLRPARTQIFGCPNKHEQGNDINDNEKRKVKTGKCQMKVYQTAEEVLRSKAAATSCSASRSPQ